MIDTTSAVTSTTTATLETAVLLTLPSQAQAQAAEPPDLPLVPAAPVAIPGLIEGAIVHYVLSKGRCKGQHRAAMVVRVLDKIKGLVNLRVFNDGLNDGNEYASGTSWETSVKHSANHEVGTWHWIEPA